MVTPAQSSTPSWNRTIWRIAGPLMIANLSVPLLGIVDTAVIGQLPGSYYIGAVAVSAQIFSVVYWGFGFIRQGTGGFTAQAFGAGNHDEVRAYFLRGLTIAVVAGLAVIILQVPLLWASLAIMNPSNEVAELARQYFNIRIWGAPAALANYAILAWFVGTQNTRYALVIQLVTNGLNIALDLVFVMGFNLGVPGVAYATLISVVAGALLGIVMINHLASRMGGHWRGDLVRRWDAMRHMLGVNRDIMLRTLCMEAAFVSLTAIGARMGDEVLAANAVLLLFQTFMAFGLDGFADAAEALSGQAFGARNPGRFKDAVRATARWAIGFSLGVCAVYWVLGGVIIDLITITPSVREVARTYLIWTAVLPFISVWAFLFDGIYFGLTQASRMRNAMLVSLLIYGASLVATIPAFGNNGLWLSFCLFMAARGTTLAFGFPKLISLVEHGPGHIKA